MKIFRTMLCTLCQNYYYIQYATMWLPLHAKVQYLHSRYQLLVNFMYFYCFHVFHREFLWPTGVNFNISYHRHQELLECQMFVTNHALFNASHSIYLFLAQWRLVLSESAVLPYVFIKCYYCLVYVLTLYHKIHELFYLCCQTKLELQEKLCNKCPGGNSFETAVVVILLVISGFTLNDRAPGGPVTLIYY